MNEPHDHALCLAGFMAFVRGVDIHETTELARVALIERALKAEAQLDALTPALRTLAQAVQALDAFRGGTLEGLLASRQHVIEAARRVVAAIPPEP